jgi:hypothetical protein
MLSLLLAAYLMQLPLPGIPNVPARTVPQPSRSENGPRFWETRPPEEWTREEVDRLLSDSPWAQSSDVRVYIASAEPVRRAELLWRDWMRRDAGPEARYVAEDDYEEFLKQHPGEHIIIGIAVPNWMLTPNPREVAEMEKQSRIKLDKRKHSLLAFFPPTPGDPVLRMVFPKKLTGDEKKLTLELYLPGIRLPFRNFEFPISSLAWKGKPAL